MASGLAEISLDKTSTLRPDKKEPVVVENLQYWFSNANDGFVLAYSKHRFEGADGNPKYSYDKRNGFNDRVDRQGRDRAAKSIEVDRPSIAEKRAGDRPLRVSRPPVTIAAEGP